MFCKDFAENLALYADDAPDENARAQLDAHLARCPLCRAKFAEFRDLRNDLRVLARPEAPATLLAAVRRSVAAEINSAKPEPTFIFTESFQEWLQFRVMPWGVGTIAALLLTFAFLSTLVSTRSATLETGAEIAGASNKTALALSNANNILNDDALLTQADYVALRLPVSNESPSVNPSGALIALTKSLVRGKMNDEEVVVVADVFGDGIARIAEVVEPPRSRQALEDLENALQNDPTYAPFVPAKLDGRSDTVRVILKIQKVDIATNLENQNSRKY